MSWENELAEQLRERKKLVRYRQRRVLESAQSSRVEVDGRQLINFCSNDYLGFANHVALKKASRRAIDVYGVGGGASHLVCGHSTEHHQLEEELAEFTGRDRVLLYSAGYMANLGVLQATLGRGDEVFQDKLNHASLLDGALMSRAKLRRFKHADTSDLAAMLASSNAKRKLVVTDGVFSMDGDIAPLSTMADIAQQNQAVLMVDDAHGFGCLGKNGAGIQEQLGLNQKKLPILLGTLGKAFGSYGAFVAGSENLIESLIQFSRTYIYTTALPPSIAAASRAALRLIISETWRREKLNKLIARFKQNCKDLDIELMPSITPIQPILVGDDKDALALSEYLFLHGFWVSAIRPPTVPVGSARLRVTLCAEHEEKDVDRLTSCIFDGMKARSVGR